MFEPAVPLVLNLSVDKTEFVYHEGIFFTVSASGGSESALTCTINSDPPGLPFDGDTFDVTVGTPTGVAVGAGDTAGTYEITVSGGGASDSVTITIAPGPVESSTNVLLSSRTSSQRGMVTASVLQLSSSSETQHGQLAIAPLRLGGVTTSLTETSTTKLTYASLRIRNARGRRTETIRLQWDPAVDVPLIYRSWIAVQIKMAHRNYEPAVSAIGADSGREVPAALRGFDSQVLKILLQPFKPDVDPEDVILEITDYA